MSKQDAIRLGIVGASLRGLGLAEWMARHNDARIVGVADPSAQALDHARKRLGDTVVLAESDEDLYRETDCDAVIVASGDPYHVANTEAALAHGKDVFLEKPIAQDMAGLRKLAAAWSASDRVVMVGLELRQCVVFSKMRRLLDEGAIGRVVQAMAFDNVSVGGTYFYHNHYRNKAHTRSLILQKGTHTIDLLNMFVGARPTRVFCLAGMNVYGRNPEARDRRCRSCDRAGTCPHAVVNQQMLMDYGEIQKLDDLCVYADGADVSDNAMALVDYANGARAFYGECHFTPEYTREFTLIGDEGKMVGFYNNACEFKVTVRRCDAPEDTNVYEPRPTVPGGHGGSDNLALAEFARRIRERDRAEDEFWEIVDGAAVAVAATESEETGQPEVIPDFRKEAAGA